MALYGDAKTFSLTAIVRMIHDEKKTGVLTVTSDHRRPRIYFRDGKIVFASGNTAKELLVGELLKANNLISEAKLQEMLAVAKSADKRLGAILVERGCISRENLSRILLYQFREVISSLLTWDNAEFTYTDGLNGYVEDIPLEIDPIRLSAEAEKRKSYRKIIPNDQVVFQIKPDALKSKSAFTNGALRVLLLIDGKRTVSQIISKTGFSRLAVYRALSNLLSADAIVRKRISTPADEMEGIEETAILAFYQALLQVITTDLSAELGDKKATASLEDSLRHSTYYERFLCAFKLDQDLDTNFSQTLTHLEKQGQTLSKKELTEGFNQVIGNLLRDEYRLLGSPATKGTVTKVRAALESVPEYQRLLAQAVGWFLDRYEDGNFPPETGGLSKTKNLGPSATTEVSLLAPKLDNISSAAIVSFYNQVIQVVMTDLERELGAKARNLFQNVMRNSSYYGSFFSRLDLGDSSETNVVPMPEHIKTQELKLGKQDLVRALQEVLIALLREESQLLGDKATHVTISHLMEEMGGQTQQKPLADHLSAFLVSETAGMAVAAGQ